MNILKQENLEAGKHYWIMLNQYHDWKIGYIGQDSDDNLWLHLIGVTNPIEVKHLTQCTAIEIEPPPYMRQPMPSERTPGEVSFVWLEDETNLVKRDGWV
jgi:hypothetical protein